MGPWARAARSQAEPGLVATPGPTGSSDMSSTAAAPLHTVDDTGPRDNEAVGVEVVAEAQPLLPAVAGAQRFNGLAGALAAGLALLVGQRVCGHGARPPVVRVPPAAGPILKPQARHGWSSTVSPDTVGLSGLSLLDFLMWGCEPR